MSDVDYCNELYAECERLKKVNAELVEALNTIISLSHSWVMAADTVNCAHTYPAIRDRAKEALAKYDNKKE